MPFNSLIFDFDGTILDTETPEFKAWQFIFQKFNLDLPLDSWTPALGTKEEHFDGCSLLEKLTSRSIDHTIILDQKKQKAVELLSQQEILPGVLDHIKRAQSLGLMLGIASSSNRSWVEGHLHRLGLISYFNAITTSEEVCQTKPEPELYLRTLMKLSCSPDSAIAYEDSPNGILAAKAAGIRCVAIPNPISINMDIHFADLLIESLATTSLDEVLQSLSTQITDH